MLAALTSVTLSLFAFAAWRTDPMRAVGGREVYARQRMEALEGLLRRAERIRDEAVHAREVEALQRQIRELRASSESTEELGAELRIERR